MNSRPSAIQLCALTLALTGFMILAVPEAQAITFGEPDCLDNATNLDCQHPNTVSLTGFSRGISAWKCSGTLLTENAHRIVILTAGHCASIFMSTNQIRRNLGVSFDAEIVRDRPRPDRPWNWSRNQYLMGGVPVLPVDYAPTYNSWVTHFDYAVVVFETPRNERFTWGGKFVDLSGISPVTLPEEDYLLDEISAPNPLQVTTVGYGVGELLVGPGEGGNAGGPVNLREKLGVRWMAAHTSAFSFMGREQHMFIGSANPARDHDGSCYGDSGGPLFYVDDGVEFQIGITSSGDNPCRAVGFNVRTDGARIVEFLACVTRPDAELEDIVACGCTEVNDKGVCPSVRNHRRPVRRER